VDRFNYQGDGALAAAELRRRLEDAVSSLTDHERRNRQVAVQQMEIEPQGGSSRSGRKLPQITTTLAQSEIHHIAESHFRAT